MSNYFGCSFLTLLENSCNTGTYQGYKGGGKSLKPEKHDERETFHFLIV